MRTGPSSVVASWLGLPVSSTHIAVGAIFGVGFFREYFTTHSKRRRRIVGQGRGRDSADGIVPGVEELRHRKLVRRTHFLTIIAAWLITVPATALLSAAVYFVFDSIR